MQNIKLVRKNDRQILFEGKYRSLRKCLESAVVLKKNLDGICLKNANLSNACLDGARMRNADLSNSNLSGANLSEADVSGSCFIQSSLFNSCLCWTNLSGCDFRFAGFGATDISGSILDFCSFSGLSAMSLNFGECLSMAGCRYEDLYSKHLEMSDPPLIINGLERFLAILDKEILIGNIGLFPEKPEAEGIYPEEAVFTGKYLCLIKNLKAAKTSAVKQLKVVDKSGAL